MSNVGLILGVAGADPTPAVVRVAGLAGLVAGAISMAAGEYNSMRVQAELFEREINLERIEIRRNPHVERAELEQLYQSRGVDAGGITGPRRFDHVRRGAGRAHPRREELGVDPDELGSPTGAAVSSFGAFCFGAVLPLVPWFIGSGTAAIWASLIGALVAAFVIGIVIARFTDRPWIWSALRQVLFTAVPAALTYTIGSLVGVHV